MTTKRSLNEFLANYPLYKSFEAVTNYSRSCEGYVHPLYIYKQTFTSLCPIENGVKVFELTLPESYIKHLYNMPEEGICKSLLDEKGKLDYVQYFEGICTSCKKHHIGFLLHVYSDYEIPLETHNIIFPDVEKDILVEQPVKIFIEKVGEYPICKINVSKEITKVLDRESSNWYYKAQHLLRESFGIGAFAYFRRIIEKELINLIKDASALNPEKSSEFTSLLLEYERTNKTYLIYENSFNLLPASLKSLGDNPFSLLYKQTSMGLHELSEEECLSKAEAVNYVLTFIITKLYEEKNSYIDTKKYLNELKK